MKKLKYLCSAFLVASLLAIPAAAQKHGMSRMGQMGRMGQRNNNGEKTRTREGWEKNAKHKAKAKGHTK